MGGFSLFHFWLPRKSKRVDSSSLCPDLHERGHFHSEAPFLLRSTSKEVVGAIFGDQEEEEVVK